MRGGEECWPSVAGEGWPRLGEKCGHRKPPVVCQAVLASQWVWSFSTDESQVTAALFSGFARFQSATRRW
jgi:hypothetical protein